jgi:hypothetical protein
MTDIVERLRTWCHAVDAESAQDLMDEAAAEIDRLRNGATCPHVRGTVTQHCSLNFTLTDEEREAVEYAAAFIHAKGLHRQSKSMVDDAATLRSLLKRLHT